MSCNGMELPDPARVRAMADLTIALINANPKLDDLDKLIKVRTVEKMRDLELQPVACVHCGETHITALMAIMVAMKAFAEGAMSRPAHLVAAAMGSAPTAASHVLNAVMENLVVAGFDVAYAPDPGLDALARAGYRTWKAEQDMAEAAVNPKH